MFVSKGFNKAENLQGEKEYGYPIKGPKNISEEKFVIICSTSLLDISEQLIAFDMVPQEDFAISPILNDRTTIIELENTKSEFYFTSGAITGTDKFEKYGNNKYGGGLFKCTVNGLEYEYEQIYQGPCYGSTRIENKILFVDTDDGLMKLENEEITKLSDLPSNSRPHGISYNQSNNHYYIALSYQDSVLELNKSFEKVDEYTISNKINRYDEAMHHCNDCLALENSLYVTMFSSSGNWKRDSFDGAIAEFDIKTGERVNDVRSNFQMPHNIDIFKGSLHLLDSLPGELCYNNFSVQGSFPGFSRGLDYESGLYYVGQSKNRNYSKINDTSKSVAIDAGVKLFEPETQISRFLHFPDIAGIHSITI
jgi:hypothetical protein